MPQALRRFASELVHRAWDVASDLGTIEKGGARGNRFGSIGEGTTVAFPLASLHGEDKIHLGDHCWVSRYVTLGAGYLVPSPLVPERALVIGDRCVIGIRTTIIAHEQIVIGDDVWFGQDVFVTDANHGFTKLDVPIGRQLGAHEPVSIGAGSWLGHGVVVLPGATIGRNVVVAAGAVVRGEIPDYCVAAGVPAKVVRRFGGEGV